MCGQTKGGLEDAVGLARAEVDSAGPQRADFTQPCLEKYKFTGGQLGDNV